MKKALDKLSHLFSNRVVILLLIISVVLFCIAVYLALKLQRVYKDPDIIIAYQSEALIKKVSGHITLPEGEVPTIATVNDPNLLKGQEFFSAAKAGDKVLFYRQAMQAILYDPVADKVITVAPLVDDPMNSDLNYNDPQILEGV